MKRPKKEHFTKGFTKEHGAIALLTVGLGNIAEVLGSLQKVNESVLSLIGYQWARHAFWAVVIVICAGYFFGYLWLYKRLVAHHVGTKKILLASSILLCAGIAFAGNLVLLPKPPLPIWKGVVGQWRDLIMRTQDNGSKGFRVEVKDPGAHSQVFATAQGLTAVLAVPGLPPQDVEPLKSAFVYLESLRNQSGEEGWGYFDNSKPTITEISAWAGMAKIESVQNGSLWTDQELPAVVESILRDLQLLIRRQDPGGGWSPIPEVSPPATRTYSSALALWSLVEAYRTPSLRNKMQSPYEDSIRRGTQWILNTYRSPQGWVPNPNRPNQTESYPGLTAQVLFVLSRAEKDFAYLRDDSTFKTAKQDFLKDTGLVERSVSDDSHLSDRDQYISPSDVQIEGMTYLWVPWSLLAYRSLSTDDSLSKEERKLAAKNLATLYSRYVEVFQRIETGATYNLAENLFCISNALRE
ncbi:MAG: hypothetical protein LAO21_08785 [Acidobacteriia bacterium]|nr:hypothetical protein [Terriglobia bacterium]